MNDTASAPTTAAAAATPIRLIRVVDLETCGFAPPAEVIEFGWSDLVANTVNLVGDPTHWTVTHPDQVFVRPTMPIPPETSAIHHIIDEDVAGAAPWDQVGPRYCDDMFRELDEWPIDAFAAHSAKFERQWITDELTGGKPFICTYKCALRLWPDAPAHSNQALRYWRRPLGLDRDRAMVAHRAGPDAYVTAFLLRDMLEMAPIADLIQWSSEPALQVRCHIGKWRGTPWREVDDGFLFWVLGKDFDEDVIFTVRHEIDRRQKEHEAMPASRFEDEDEE